MAIDYKDIGQRIKAKRIEKGLTQEKLSEAKIQESAGESAPDATKVKEK